MIKFLKDYGWAIWICHWLGLLGFGVTTWQFWFIYLILVILVAISKESYLKDSKVEKESGSEKKDFDYFR
jgi:hypothetical protein